MTVFVFGLLLIGVIILVVRKLKRDEELFHSELAERRLDEKELDDIDNFDEELDKIEKGIKLVNRQEVLVDKRNELKEKIDSVESKSRD